MLSSVLLLHSVTPWSTFVSGVGISLEYSAWKNGASKSMMNLLSSIGTSMRGSNRELGGYMPLEGLWARLFVLATYLVWNWTPEFSEGEWTDLKT